MDKYSDPEMEVLAEKWHTHLHQFPHISELVKGDIEGEELREIQDIHGDLAEWQAYNAGLVRRIIDGQKLRLSGFMFRRDPKLGAKIDRLASRYPKQSDLFVAYRKVYTGMLELIELASRINGRR